MSVQDAGVDVPLMVLIGSQDQPAEIGQLAVVLSPTEAFGTEQQPITLSAGAGGPSEVPAEVVIWTPLAVAFQIPQSLSDITADYAYTASIPLPPPVGTQEVQLAIDAPPAIFPSPGAPVVLMAVGGEALPTTIGGPAVAVALAPTSFAGDVGAGNEYGLTIAYVDGQGAQRTLPVPTEQVTWTPEVIFFEVPPLPGLPLDATAQATLTIQPSGGAAAATAALRLIPAPPLRPTIAAVTPPLAFAGDTVTAIGTLFGTQPQLFDAGGATMTTNAAAATPAAVVGALPTVEDLQTRLAYARNEVVVQLAVGVRDGGPSQEGPGRESGTLPVVAVLPPPSPGPVGVDGRNIYFGDVAGEATLGVARHLGSVSNVTVTVHGAPPNLPALPSFAAPSSTIQVPASTLQQLAAIRSGAAQCTVELGSDDGLIASLPDSYQQTIGWVVVWRDDLPSPPILLVTLPQLPADTDDLLGLIRQLVNVQITPDDPPGPSNVLAPGDALQVALAITDQLPPPGAGTDALGALPGGPNPLKLLLDLDIGYGLDLGAQLLDASGNPVAAGATSMINGALSTPSQFNVSPELSLLLKPALVEQAAPGDLYTLEVMARLRTPDNPGGTVLGPVTSLNVTQMPVQIPAFLALFMNPSYSPIGQGGGSIMSTDGGAVLVVVPPNVPIYNVPQLEGILGPARDALDKLALVARFSGIPAGTELSTALNAIKAQDVVVVNGDQGNLNDIVLIENPWYWNNVEAEDEASSLILIGAPQRSVTVYSGRDCEGAALNVTVDPALVIAKMIPDLSKTQPNMNDRISSLKWA